MERPMPIIWFERCYLGAVALRLLADILSWDRVNAGAVQVGLIVALLLWFGVVHRHSNVARWLVLLFFGGAAVVTLMRIAAGGLDVPTNVLTLAALGLNAVAAFLLLVPEARPWFAKPQPDKSDG
jgi:hypothetical protein